jgi:NTE family protein
VVGLALSGGGARGFAHIGVLQALEELRIPVGRIAGTSMGAVVGGLYAAGYSPAEIEGIVTESDWDDLFRDAAPRNRLGQLEREGTGRYLVSLPMERLRIRIPTGITEGDKITNLLSILLVRRSALGSFDELPVPFRAVTTDLVTGERVALDGGDLPEAIRASLALPLVFTPVERDGRILADGGLSDNLPTDVASEMGAEVIVASDVSSPLRGRTELDTPLGVADQTISIQIVATARARRELADILIQPPLEGVATGDFRRAKAIVRAGYEAAMASPALRELSLRLDRVDPVPRPPREPIRIGRIRIEGTDRIHRRELEKAESQLTAAGVTESEIERVVAGLLAGRSFRKVRLQLLRRDPDPPDLLIRVSGVEGDAFHFSARADDKYGLLGLVNLTIRDLGGGENRASFDFQAGSQSRVAGEFLAPAEPGVAAFFRASALASRDLQLARAADGSESEFSDDRWGAEIAGGNTFRNLGAVSLGYRLQRVDFHREGGDAILAPFDGRVAALVLRSRVDTLDRSAIPGEGRCIDLSFEAARPGLGGRVDYDRARLEAEVYATRGRHTLGAGLLAGTSFEDDLPEFEQFRLGGTGYLWGFEREELRGNHAAGVRLDYRLLLLDAGSAFFQQVWLEVGADGANAWARRDAIGGGLHADAHVSLVARTWLGPLRINAGAGEGGRRNLTFSFGFPF